MVKFGSETLVPELESLGLGLGSQGFEKQAPNSGHDQMLIIQISLNQLFDVNLTYFLKMFFLLFLRDYI